MESKLLEKLSEMYDEEGAGADEGGKRREVREGWREDARALSGLNALCYGRFLVRLLL